MNAALNIQPATSHRRELKFGETTRRILGGLACAPASWSAVGEGWGHTPLSCELRRPAIKSGVSPVPRQPPQSKTLARISKLQPKSGRLKEPRFVSLPLQQPASLIAFCCSESANSVKLIAQTEPLTAMNEGQIRRRIFLRLLGHPLVIAPSVLGATAWTAIWALSLPSGLGLFAGLAGILGSAGVYLTRLILDDGKTARDVLADEELGEQKAAQAALDDLDRRLVAADQDPRPETALRDMRALLRAFDEFAGKTDSLNAPAVIEVRSRVQQIFNQTVRSLEQTLRLGDTAKQLSMAAARKPLLQQREKIIADVEACTKQLGDTLAALQTLGSGARSNNELSRLRDELDQSLQIAGRVEDRLNSLLNQTESDIRSQPSRLGGINNPKGN